MKTLIRKLEHIIIGWFMFSFRVTMLKLTTLLVLVNFGNFSIVYGNVEFYSAVTQIEDLLTTEGQFVDILEQFVKREEKKLQEIEQFMEYLQEQNNRAKENRGKYVENPMNAFLLIKRLSVEWKYIEDMLKTQSPKAFVNELSTTTLTLPTETDMAGTIEALIRLQETYNLNTTLMASGILNGIKYSNEMTSFDCFIIGMRLHNHMNDFTLALSWFLEAKRRYNLEDTPKFPKSLILEYIASCYFHKYNISKATAITKQLLRDDPTNQRLQDKLRSYMSSVPNVPESSKQFHGIAMDEYQALCRGEHRLSEEKTSKLRCIYHKPTKNKFLQLAPFKVEEVLNDPKMVIFHNIIYDAEINLLQKLAKPKLFRTQTVNNEKYDRPASFRIGKMSWLNDGDHSVVASLTQRIQDMTGLSMSSSESLQVLNYGIGGQYEPHHDYFEKDNTKGHEFIENRIATVLIYLNDVEQGGATVFPLLGLRIPAKKGTAAFWYNLHSNLERDPRTLHGACPVLVGQKWISNKWVHDIAQTFHKPCNLKPIEDP